MPRPGDPVTEFDLRAREFKRPDIKPEDFEWREDGAMVRKDRWIQAVHSIANHLCVARGWEIEDIIRALDETIKKADAFDHLVEVASHKSDVSGNEVILRIYDPRTKEDEPDSMVRCMIEADVLDGVMQGDTFVEAATVLKREFDKLIDNEIPF